MSYYQRAIELHYANEIEAGFAYEHDQDDAEYDLWLDYRRTRPEWDSATDQFVVWADECYNSDDNGNYLAWMDYDYDLNEITNG